MRLAVWTVRVAAACYVAALTVLLLARDPVAWLLGIVPDFSPPTRGVHSTAFCILTLLAAASRLPWKASRVGTLLVVYALATETLQGLVESRTVELVDYCENLIGLAAGAMLWTAGAWILRQRQKSDAARN